MPIPFVHGIDGGKDRYPFRPNLHLPGTSLGQSYKITLPSLINSTKLEAPSFKIDEYFHDPLPNLLPLYLPESPNQAPEMRAERGLLERHARMKRHHRMKRFKRDLTLYKRRHKRRKQAAEKRFQDKIADIIAEANAFSPESYVDSILRVAHKKRPQRIVYEYDYYQSKVPHWTEVMTIEQLYGVPASDRIDKNTGFASEEELEEIKNRRNEYEETFKKLKPVKKD